MKQYIKKLIIDLFGYEIRKKPETEELRGFQPAHLAKLCQPKTVIDVGVGYGTYPLYEAFPHARFILVEPLMDYESVIGEISKRYDCKVYYKAVGKAEGVLEFTVDTHDLEKSSFQDRTALTTTGHALERRRVDVTTLDAILRDNPGMETPILLKLDTEGHELDVLHGATELLRRAETVIAEVSLARRFENSYEFEDLLAFMKQHGYRMFDILTVAHAHDELQPRFMDVVFKRAQVAGGM